MPISHLCNECGADLALVRPTVEPIYGWRIRACDACARAGRTSVFAVRTGPSGGDPRRIVRRRICTFVRAAAFLTLNSLLSLVLVFGVAASCDAALYSFTVLGVAPALIFEPSSFFSAVGDITSDRLIEWMIEGEGLNLLPMVCFAGLAGAWIESALGHWPRRRRWAVFFLSVLGVCWWWTHRPFFHQMLAQGLPPMRAIVINAFNALKAQSPMVVLSLAPAAAGGWLGRIVRRRAAARRSLRFRRLRGKLESRRREAAVAAGRGARA